MALINFSGLASGIDSAALIDALIDQKRKTRVDPLENKISELEETNSAFEELSSLLNNLKSSADGFRQLYGGAISKLAASSDETIVTASASNQASNGSYAIDVSQMATNGSFSLASDDITYNNRNSVINSNISNAAPAADRTVSFQVGTGGNLEDVDIVLTDSSTLAEFVEDFNSQSSLASASLVNVGTDTAPDYVVHIVTNNSGTEKGTVTMDSIGAQVTGAGIGAFDDNASSAAQNAVFSIAGIGGTISRQSNTINDVITGLTLQFNSTGSATVNVESDAEATAASLRELVDSYNSVVEFIEENDLVSREEDGNEIRNIFGPLANSSLDDNILSALRNSIGNSGTTGGDVNILADLGITTERDGTLKFDEEIFNEAVNTDTSSVNNILMNLGEDLSATNGTIDQFIRFNGLIDQTVNSNITQLTNMQKRVSETENRLSREEEAHIARFARLETLLSGLQSQQSALQSILPG